MISTCPLTRGDRLVIGLSMPGGGNYQLYGKLVTESPSLRRRTMTRTNYIELITITTFTGTTRAMCLSVSQPEKVANGTIFGSPLS